MKQKVIELRVTKDGVELYRNDACSPQTVIASLELFASVGNVITLEIKEFPLPDPSVR